MDFILGCNYWASHAGTEMWREWDESVVRSDLKRLANHGIKYMRVFPTWRDFQPVKSLYTSRIRLREHVNENNGQHFDNIYFLDMTMIDRFRTFCDIAHENGIRLIVGIVTGFMSGSLYIPSALNERNLFTDPKALLLQQKYVKGFVTYLKDCPAIYAWDLGNECNCMCVADDYNVASNWTGLIANVIRSVDHTRPVVSGMHSLTIDGVWRIEDQGEHTDILTTHPYPHWTPHCEHDTMGSIRALMHATAESVYYASIGGKPCLVEELGTMGPMFCDDKVAGDFLRVNMFSNWANGQVGVMWWCANEQNKLDFSPYVWGMTERELGMFDENQNPKPIALEMKKFSEFVYNLPFDLPKCKIDGVCIISNLEDHWGIAYMTYILAKQAGLTIAFCDARHQLPDADFYLLPSINNQVMHKEQYFDLKEKVHNGAKLYLSNDYGFITEFEEFTGLHIKDSENANEQRSMLIDGSTINFKRSRRFITEATNAEVIADDDNGMPCYSVNKYGNGEVYYLGFPLEKNLLDENYAFDKEYYKIYRKFFESCLDKKVITTDNPYVCITEHHTDDGLYAVLVNYSGESRATNVKIADGYKVSKSYYKNYDMLEPYDAAVIYLKK